MKIKNPAVPALLEMLRYRRAHNSLGERAFIMKFVMPLKPTIISTDEKEPMAFFVYVGKSNIMFTSHVDTVHMKSDAVFQKVILKDGLYQKDDNQPLGADDGAGVWLMLNMIRAGIPGIYAFFRGEERGGIGSSWCAKNRKDLFKDVQCAIAFDRRGTNSIITHQGGRRGCSEEFSRGLANVIGMTHSSDPTGLYTDTKEFFGIVPNCTNLSVGYNNEHSKNETLIKGYIEALRDKLIMADWSKLDHTPPTEDPPYKHTPVKFSDAGHGTALNKTIFEKTYEIGPLDIADFLFDNCQQLPKELMNEALTLSQRIYKRFE